MSNPTVINNKPNAVLKNAFVRFFDSIDATIVSPKIASEKKAGGPNFNAIFEIGKEKKIKMSEPVIPPITLASKLVPSALPG